MLNVNVKWCVCVVCAQGGLARGCEVTQSKIHVLNTGGERGGERECDLIGGECGCAREFDLTMG